MSNVTTKIETVFTSKEYSSRSNALRAAKTAHADALKENQVEAVQTETGKWVYNVNQEVEVQVEEKQAAATIEHKEKSEVKNPCALVWEIAEEQREINVVEGTKLSRKAVIEKCVEAGVAYNTARTQYQLWHQSRMGMRQFKD